MLYKNSDFCKAKPSGLIAVPEMKTVQLTPQHEFLLLECDGITDVITHQEAVEFIGQKLKEHNGDPQVVAQLLVEEAYRKGSLDNITALLVTFQWPTTAAAPSAPTTAAT
jgi:protein phosphatase PTC2/3